MQCVMHCGLRAILVYILLVGCAYGCVHCLRGNLPRSRHSGGGSVSLSFCHRIACCCGICLLRPWLAGMLQGCLLNGFRLHGLCCSSGVSRSFSSSRCGVLRRTLRGVAALLRRLTADSGNMHMS